MELRKLLKYLCPYFLILKLYGCASVSGDVKENDTQPKLRGTDAGPVYSPVLQGLYDPIGNVTIHPPEIRDLIMGGEKQVDVNYTCTDRSDNIFLLQVSSKDTGVATVSRNATSLIKCPSADTFVNTITLRGHFIGKTNLIFRLRNASSSNEGDSITVKDDYSVAVGRGSRRLTTIFIITIAIFMVVLNIGFGCGLDLAEVKKILKRPIAPAIGFACQFVLMPMLGFGVSHMLGMSKALGIGLLVTTTSPGGGGSNVWTVMLGGDLNLSLTMTFISKIAALGTMPFWLFALGRFYTQGTSFQIPYFNIVTGLIALVVPAFIGLLIRRFRPTIAQKLVRLLKPGGLIFVLYVIIFGSISNVYVYTMMVKHWYVVPSIMMCTYGGYLFGSILGYICLRDKRRAITIGIETGIQDTGIAVILLQGTFPIPEGDIGATIPMLTGLFTPWPLFFTFLGMMIYKKKYGGSWDNENAVEAEEEATKKDLMVPDSPTMSPQHKNELSPTAPQTELSTIANGAPLGASNGGTPVKS